MNVGTFAGRRVFVTGATGLVGSHLTGTLLDRGATVITLVCDVDRRSLFFSSGTSEKVTLVHGCLEDFHCLERALLDHRVDTVFHLGAQALVTEALRYPLSTFEVNIRGTYNLLEACRRHRGNITRIVVASSDKAYGESPSLPYTEEMPLSGRAPYDVSKSCADLLAQAYQRTYDLPIATMRCGNIFGPGDLHWSRLIPGTIRSLVRGERPVIRSDGTYTRDYLYVQDVVEAYISVAAVCGQGGEYIFNVGPEKPSTVLEVVHLIASLMGREDLEPLVLNEASDEIHDQYLSSERAQHLLGWKLQYTLEEGLRLTIPWYEKLLEHERSSLRSCAS